MLSQLLAYSVKEDLAKLTNNGQERDILEGSVQGEETEDNQSNDTPENSTSCMVRENIHGNGKSQKMRCHAEYAVNDVSSTEDLSSPATQQDSTNVYISCNLKVELETGNIFNCISWSLTYLRISHFELPQDVTRVCGENTESKNGNETTNETNIGQNSW